MSEKELQGKSEEAAILVEEYKDAPPDAKDRIAELESLISEARALAAERAEMMSKAGLSPFESPFETVKREHVTKTRDLNRRLVEHATVSHESRIVSQFEDTPPTPRDDTPYGIWNLGYRLEDLALAVSNIILNDFDNGIFDHDHDEYVTKDELEGLIPEIPEIPEIDFDPDDYAPAVHEHEYQPKGDYAASGHGHSDKADKNHTHDDLIPVPVSYRLETDANTRGMPSIQLVDQDDNYSDVTFHAGEGVEVTSQASALTVGLSEDHLAQVDQNRQDIQLLWAATGDKMEIQEIVTGQWMFAGENKLSPRAGEFSMDDWQFSQVSQIFIGQKQVRGTWSDVRINDEIHVIDATQYEGDPVLEKDRYQGKYIVTNIIDNSGAMLLCDVELVSGFGTIRENKPCTIKVRGARVPDHSGRIDDQQKQIEDLIARLDAMATDEVASSYGHRFKQDSGYFQYAGFQKIQDGRFCWDGKRTEIYISAKDMYGAKWRHMTHSDKSVGTQIGTIYEIGDSNEPIKFVTQFNFEILNASSYVVTIKNVNIIFNTGSSNLGNKDYIINLGGVM